MTTNGGVRGTGVEHDMEGFPAHHYRGRGNNQARTGPAREWLDEDAASFLTRPGPEKKPRARRGKRNAGEIADEIYDTLAVHTDFDDARIDIEVRIDEVRLRGVVRSELASLRAQELAAEVRGVRSVVNELRVVRGRAARRVRG